MTVRIQNGNVSYSPFHGLSLVGYKVRQADGDTSAFDVTILESPEVQAWLQCATQPLKALVYTNSDYYCY